MNINHPNKKRHNWLFYKLMEQKLTAISSKLKGVVYDLGCGELPYAEYISDSSVASYVGVDWSSTPHLLKADIVADLNKPLPIESEMADTVISISVLEHLSNPQLMLNESFRILKPGGFAFFQVPFQWMVHEAPYDYFRYTPYGLGLLLSNAGYEGITIEPMGGYFTAHALKANYFLSRLIRGPYIMRAAFYTLLLPIWYLHQIAAPLLDRLDKNHSLETIGYFVTAKKPLQVPDQS